MWQYDEPQDGILLVRIDRNGKPVNSFSIETMNALRDVATFVASRSEIETVIFISGKRGNFLAGADLYEIRANATFDATLKMSRNGHSAFQAIEELEATTIAAIDGVALGGGLEFAMACDFRIVTDSPRTLLGLPEVHLGLMPGWGATVRLPELVGYELATDLLLTGRSVLASEANEAGLVDTIVAAGDELEKAAITFARSDAEKRSAVSFDVDAITKSLAAHEESVRDATNGQYPAPLKMIEVLREGLSVDQEKKYDLEANGIATLAPDPVTEQLIRLFFMKEAAKKPPADVKEAAKAFELKRIGVVGDNAYGENIAGLFAERGVKTDLAFLGQPDPNSSAPSYELLTRTSDANDLGDANVVVEAIVDDLDAERGLFQTLGIVVHPDSVIASTSASFLLSEQSKGLSQPERLIGLRFFSPVEKTPLLEVIRQDCTSSEALAAAYAIARRLGRQVVLAKDSPGFLVNRVLLPYLTEVGYLMTEVEDPQLVLDAVSEFGMSESPLKTIDLLGLHVLGAISKRMHTELAEHLPPAPLWRAMMDSAEPNMKFLTEDGSLNSAVTELIAKVRSENSSGSEDSLVERLVYPMINAGASCLAEGVAESAEAIDLAMILVGGFPAFRGGPMQYAEEIGIDKVAEALTRLSENNSRIAPGDALKQFAESGSFSTAVS